MLTRNLTGALLRSPCMVSGEDLEAIHGLPNPPLVPLERDEVYIRRCRLASDGVDSRFGRFRTEDLRKMLELVRGAPVLVGHDHRSLGVARFFGGEVEKRGDTTWLVPRFYFPRAHSGAEDLRIMIDSGVYNEASIAFLYRTPTCSICGEDLRQCPHWPGRTYDGSLCFYWYDGVERVMEGSIVYRGAAEGTGFELDNPVAPESLQLEFVGNESGMIDTPETSGTFRVKRRGKRYLARIIALEREHTPNAR